MTPGTILHDPDFQFHDGTSGNKLLIVLNDGACGFYIIVKTTSNPNHKSWSYGCHLDDRFQNFSLPEDSCCLDGDSWVMLDEFYPFDMAELLNKKFSGRLKPIGGLIRGVLRSLVECAVESDDISGAHEQVLRNTLV